MSVYCNDNDEFCCAWLRELMKEGLIPDGVVDSRSIRNVDARDLEGFTQVHFFAGIGGWPYALRLAGWGDRPVWTGSCPCQPFSAAGKHGGVGDARHLWPDFFRLIAERRPSVVFGEQVASKDGLAWLDGVRADVEGTGYAFGAADLCAAGVGAPHIRQRLYWVADADGGIASDGDLQRGGEQRQQPQDGGAGGLGDAASIGYSRDETEQWRDISEEPEWAIWRESKRSGNAGGLGDACGPDGERNSRSISRKETAGSSGGKLNRNFVDRPQHASTSMGFWSDTEWIRCLDGKARRTGPGIFPLAYGVPNRVGALRGAGNAIVPQVAAEFIRAYCEASASLESQRPAISRALDGG